MSVVAGTLALTGPHPPAIGLRGLGTAAGRVPAVTWAIAGAWLLLAGAQLTGASDSLHHHALIEHGPALWIAVPMFLAAWLAMVVAMMLPASLPAVAAHLGPVSGSAGDRHARSRRRLVHFLTPYLVAWAGFGMAMFLGDTAVHRVVHATPWLEARTWLIDAAVLAFAGAYQLLPVKRRSLETCRHPGRAATGRDHALACLAGSWALMLLMFSEGFSNPAWMLALTAVMTYEAVGRHGRTMATVAGVALLALALGIVLGGRAV